MHNPDLPSSVSILPNTTKIQTIEIGDHWYSIGPIIAWRVSTYLYASGKHNFDCAEPIGLESIDARCGFVLEDGRVLFPEDCTYDAVDIAIREIWAQFAKKSAAAAQASL